MTANELADELGNILTFLEIEYADYEDDEILKQASTMLRQQQVKIEALKKDLALKTRDRDVFANFTLAYEKRIEELEKGGGWLEETDEQVIANAEKRFPFLKRRELTDEEIDQIIKQHDWYSKTWVDMVRSIESAILKKASEK